MSRGLVSAKPFAKKKKKNSFKRVINRTGISLPTVSLNISKKAKEILSRSVIGIILLTFWFIFLIRGVFFKAEFTMNQVKRSEQTLATYEDIDIFNIISAEIKGQNYYVLNQFKKDTILDKAKQQFPFLNKMTIQLETGNTLGIDLTFHEPIFKVKLGEQEFWIWWNNQFFEIKSGMNLWRESFIIDTPQYLTGTTNLSGLFFEINVDTFTKIVPMIQEEIPNITRFVYLAGSSRIAIFNDNDQVIFFNITTPENLQIQFEKYHNLQQYYQNFDRLASIYLWSLDENKIIVRKK